MTQPSPTTAATPPDNASFAEDLVDIFVSPAKVFARRAKSNPMAPYLVVCVVMIVLFFASKSALAPIFDAQIQKAIDAAQKANPTQVTADAAAKMRPIIAVSINVAGVIGVPILLLVVGLITWIVGRFLLGGTLSFGAALMIASYAWMPKLIAGVVGLVEGLTMDVSRMTSPYQLSIAVSRFFDPSTMSDGLYQLLGQVDLFSIWTAFLIGVGLMHAGKVGKTQAIVGGVVMWCAGAMPAIWAVLTGK
jgi:hypothetical protein